MWGSANLTNVLSSMNGVPMRGRRLSCLEMHTEREVHSGGAMLALTPGVQANWPVSFGAYLLISEAILPIPHSKMTYMCIVYE